MRKLFISLNLLIIFVLGCLGSSDDSDSIEIYDIEFDLGSGWEVESAAYDVEKNSGNTLCLGPFGLQN